MSNVMQFPTPRGLLIEQAVKDAANKHFAWGIQQFGMARVMQKILDGDDLVRAGFYIEVCDEFETLSANYVPPTPDYAVTDSDFEVAVNRFGEFHG